MFYITVISEYKYKKLVKSIDLIRAVNKKNMKEINFIIDSNYEVFFSKNQLNYIKLMDNGAYPTFIKLFNIYKEIYKLDLKPIFIFDKESNEEDISYFISAMLDINIIDNIENYKILNNTELDLERKSNIYGYFIGEKVTLNQGLVLVFNSLLNLLEFSYDIVNENKSNILNKIDLDGNCFPTFSPDILEFKKIMDNDKKIISADLIFSGGRGIGGENGFDLLKKVANKYKASYAGTRPCFEQGLFDSNHLVGQSGYTVKPKVYVAFGISGSIQHIAGMKDSDTVIAVNTDPNARIIQVADYALIEDAVEVLKIMLDND